MTDDSRRGDCWPFEPALPLVPREDEPIPIDGCFVPEEGLRGGPTVTNQAVGEVRAL